MTWTMGFVLILGILIKMITSPPSAAVAWVLKKFAIHQEINEKEITLVYDSQLIEGQVKEKVVTMYNEASFLKRIHIYPGNEDLFMPHNQKTVPYHICYSKGKKKIQLYLYIEEKYLTVVKQTKRKLIAYQMSAKEQYIECEENSIYSNSKIDNM
ncbi:YfmQ family protein [Cytobacillus sp. FSL W7-1323]|uniref:YfmQ family protein n=1 Tax=Cytobacillus TaxID=2675230 RepID=UPI002AFED229|nr:MULTISPECIES: YfmQ family protein [Cytobacillus]MEA1853975.1 YfmQ family protein [Cytobacillus sp. OWB-43]MED1605345.1 YfmQ family protein [Cytobacillus kochii]